MYTQDHGPLPSDLELYLGNKSLSSHLLLPDPTENDSLSLLFASDFQRICTQNKHLYFIWGDGSASCEMQAWFDQYFSTQALLHDLTAWEG